MSTTLYRGGFVHAVGAPRATAMLVEDAEGVVTWVGDEAAADRLGRPDRVMDLDGTLAAPAFTDACTLPGVEWAAARSGTASVHVAAGLPGAPAAAGAPAGSTAGSTAAAGAGIATVLYWYGSPTERPDGARPATTSTDPDVVEALVRTATDEGRQCSLWAGDDPAAVLRGVDAADRAGSPTGRRVAALGHRLVTDVTLPDPVVAAVTRFGMVVVVVDGTGGSPVDLRALAAAGVPFAFGSHAPALRAEPGVDPDPWDAVRRACSGGTGAVSARAAFAAATRGGRRAAGMPGGDLRPGAEATFAVWAFDGDLVVRTPDSRLAAWSTDPRAATPGLPDLERGTPRCRQLVIAGRGVDVTHR